MIIDLISYRQIILSFLMAENHPAYIFIYLFFDSCLF